MKQRILHIIRDQKFPDSAYDLFESMAPGGSEYVLPDKNKPIKYLKKVSPKRITKFSFLNPFFRKSLEKYDVVILHALTEFNCELIARSSSRVNFLWIGLGYDYYDLIYPDKSRMLGPRTLDFVKESIPQFLESEPRTYLRKIFHKLIYPNIKNKSHILKKIRWFAPVLATEYDLVKASVGEPLPFPEYIDWNYGLTARLIKNNTFKPSCGAVNILVGNSASPFNNHLDIFTNLLKLKLSKNSKIIVPLSYGDKVYRDKVIYEGRKIWGERFMPITEFMSFDEYMNILSSCSTVFMNHYRQQAGGNIAAALFMGAKVFLNRKNGFYHEYKKHEAIFFDIDMLEKEKVLLEEPLSSIDAEKNREIVRYLRSREVAERKTKVLLHTVCGEI